MKMTIQDKIQIKKTIEQIDLLLSISSKVIKDIQVANFNSSKDEVKKVLEVQERLLLTRTGLTSLINTNQND
jgi:hypothetical protein